MKSKETYFCGLFVVPSCSAAIEALRFLRSSSIASKFCSSSFILYSIGPIHELNCSASRRVLKSLQSLLSCIGKRNDVKAAAAAATNVSKKG